MALPRRMERMRFSFVEFPGCRADGPGVSNKREPSEDHRTLRRLGIHCGMNPGVRRAGARIRETAPIVGLGAVSPCGGVTRGGGGPHRGDRGRFGVRWDQPARVRPKVASLAPPVWAGPPSKITRTAPVPTG